MFWKLCASKVTGTRFYVSGHAAKSTLGGPNFFKKEYLSKFFVSSCHKNYYISYAFVNRKNRKLRPNLLLRLRAMFSKIRARYQTYLRDPLVNAPVKMSSSGMQFLKALRIFSKRFTSRSPTVKRRPTLLLSRCRQ